MSGFDQFPAETLAFLRDLRANNDKVWFDAHRDRYERAYKAPLAAFASAMAEALGEETGRPHSAKPLRIFRDTRFSKDKRPYNDHVRVSFSPTAPAASHWFVGFDPDGLTVGRGAFQFEGAALEAYRNAVDDAETGAALARVVAALEEGGARFIEPALTRTPAPYAKDHPRAALLRRKGLAAWFDLGAPERAAEPGFIAACIAAGRRAQALGDWLDAALT